MPKNGKVVGGLIAVMHGSIYKISIFSFFFTKTIFILSNLNGPYRTEKYSKQRGIGWYYWNGNDYSYKFAEMKIRPKSYWLYQPED